MLAKNIIRRVGMLDRCFMTCLTQKNVLNDHQILLAEFFGVSCWLNEIWAMKYCCVSSNFVVLAQILSCWLNEIWAHEILLCWLKYRWIKKKCRGAHSKIRSVVFLLAKTLFDVPVEMIDKCFMTCLD